MELLNRIDLSPQHVLVRIDNAPDTTPKGIILPDRMKNLSKPVSGVVVKAGEACSVLLNDNVLLHKLRGQKIDIEGEAYYIVFEDDLLSTI